MSSLLLSGEQAFESLPEITSAAGNFVNLAVSRYWGEKHVNDKTADNKLPRSD